MSYCPECGAKIKTGSNFCGNCGKACNVNNVTGPLSPKVTESHIRSIKLIIAAVLVITIDVALYTSLAKSSIFVSSPETVAKTFVEGVIKRDKSVTRLCAGDDVARAWNTGVMAIGLSMSGDREFTYKVIKRSGKQAVVEVTGKTGHLCNIELENINGKWLVTCAKLDMG